MSTSTGCSLLFLQALSVVCDFSFAYTAFLLADGSIVEVGTNLPSGPLFAYFLVLSCRFTKSSGFSWPNPAILCSPPVFRHSLLSSGIFCSRYGVTDLSISRFFWLFIIFPSLVSAEAVGNTYFVAGSYYYITPFSIIQIILALSGGFIPLFWLLRISSSGHFLFVFSLLVWFRSLVSISLASCVAFFFNIPVGLSDTFNLCILCSDVVLNASVTILVSRLPVFRLLRGFAICWCPGINYCIV